MIKQVIIDKGIPFLDDVFPPEIEVLHLSPEEITPAAVREADALFVRTRTRIDKELFIHNRMPKDRMYILRIWMSSRRFTEPF